MEGVQEHEALVRRVSVAVGLGFIVLVSLLVVLVGLVAHGALPWVVGACLVLAVAGVLVVGAHAGGHGWFVPVPVLVLAAIWGIAASAGDWSSPVSWTLAAVVLAGAVGGALLVFPAIALRRMPAGPPAGPALVGASGTALSALSPRGIAKVNNETWTAESISGPLPAGAPVHVSRVEGVRLLVWSEAGSIPGPEVLGPAPAADGPRHNKEEEA